MSPPNSDLRLRIVDLVCSGRGGHIPSSFSIIDILDCVYNNYIMPEDCDSLKETNYTFTLSKGHAACALYSVLHKYGCLSTEVLDTYLQYSSILGGHPDSTNSLTKIRLVLGASTSVGRSCLLCMLMRIPTSTFPLFLELPLRSLRATTLMLAITNHPHYVGSSPNCKPS
jgi:transketolase N-terminal domain/subunit